MVFSTVAALKQNGMSTTSTAPSSWSTTRGAPGLPYWAYGYVLDNDTKEPIPYPRIRVYTPDGRPFGDTYIGDSGGVWNMAIPDDKYLIEISDRFGNDQKYFAYKNPAKVVSNGYKLFIRKDPARNVQSPVSTSLPALSENVATSKQVAVSNALAELTTNTPSQGLGETLKNLVTSAEDKFVKGREQLLQRFNLSSDRTAISSDGFSKYIPWLIVGVLGFFAYKNRAKIKRFISRPKL